MRYQVHTIFLIRGGGYVQRPAPLSIGMHASLKEAVAAADAEQMRLFDQGIGAECVVVDASGQLIEELIGRASQERENCHLAKKTLALSTNPV